MCLPRSLLNLLLVTSSTSMMSFLEATSDRKLTSSPVDGNDLETGCQLYQMHHKKRNKISEAMDERNRLVELAEIFYPPTSPFAVHSATEKLWELEQDDKEEADGGRRVKRQSLPDTLARSVTVLCGDQAENLIRCNPRSRFRTMSGQCNNLNNPLWGASTRPFERYLNADYADGRGIPRGGFVTDPADRFNADVSNRIDFGGSFCLKPNPAKPLPSPRAVSARFHRDVAVNSRQLTHMVTQFGQFLDHDLTFTPESSHGEQCCTSNRGRDCFPIDVPSWASGGLPPSSSACLNFGRSSAFCLDRTGPREQMNTLTAFVDASHTYGASDEEARALRLFRDGLLKVSFVGGNPREMLPRGERISNLFITGDVRGTEMPGLAALHTLFIREHNRIARHLALEAATSGANVPNDEELFQLTRRIVVAEWQNIVYGEYLPVILGKEAMSRHKVSLPRGDSYTNYDPNLNPGIRNSFATAAYRFGHSQIQGLVMMLSNNGRNNTFRLRNNFFRMQHYLEDEGRGMDRLLMGLATQPAAERDRFVTQDVTNGLFPGLDLVARNIQRGRDHGLPAYQAFRDFCGAEPACDWQRPPRELSSADWSILSQLYADPSDVDLFAAGVAERNYAGGVLGRTFGCIVGRQFRALMDGDRFFFTHRDQTGSFTPAQLSNLRRRTLRDVICENTAVEQLQTNVFLSSGRRRDCRFTNRLDFRLFV